MKRSAGPRTFAILTVLLLSASPAAAAPRYLWRGAEAEAPTPNSVERKFQPPSGYVRIPVQPDSFSAWLRSLPLKPGNPPVLLYNGTPKARQDVQAAVVAIDVGNTDLQQCADAVIRLRAEYLKSRGCDRDIAFHFTSGAMAKWTSWKDGLRPVVDGDEVTWKKSGTPDGSYESFRRYLDSLFRYAGTMSLSQEVVELPSSSDIRPGDLFVHGGSPGHAVIVLDVAENSRGERMMLLGQSYMPAQEIHVLRNLPGTSAWYPMRDDGVLSTPEWQFKYREARRFPSMGCDLETMLLK